MNRSVTLVAMSILCLVAGARVGRGDHGGDPPPPDCGDCDCAQSTAWKPAGGTSIQVYATYDPGNPDSYGVATATAHTAVRAGNASVLVYAPLCLSDYHTADSAQYKEWDFDNVNWSYSCTRLGTQTTQGWQAYWYQDSTNRTPAGLVTRYTCE